MFECVLVHKISVWFAIAIRPWLITVHLMVLLQKLVVVASRAMLHIHVSVVIEWIRHSKNFGWFICLV